MKTESQGNPLIFSFQEQSKKSPGKGLEYTHKGAKPYIRNSTLGSIPDGMDRSKDSMTVTADVHAIEGLWKSAHPQRRYIGVSAFRLKP